MFEKMIAKIIFNKLLTRPDISKAYALTDPSDSWYETLKKVHDSLAKITTLPHKIETITSFDGLKLSAVFYPCRKEEVKGTVLFIHGFRSHAEREWAFPGLFYLEMGYNVIIPYQRAHGLSEGKYITFGAFEKRDMLDWIKKADNLYPNTKIVLHGLSMGGGIALQMADEIPANVKCIISDAPANSLEDLFLDVAKHISKKNYQKIKNNLDQLFEKKVGMNPNVTNLDQYVKKAKCPIFLTAGSLENMLEYFNELEKISKTKTKILILPGCNHGNGMYKQTAMYQDALSEFLNENIKSEE